MELHQAQEGRVSDRQLQMMWFTFVEKVQVFAKDASHDLSYEKLAYNLDKIHPRITVKDPKSKLAHFFN